MNEQLDFGGWLKKKKLFLIHTLGHCAKKKGLKPKLISLVYS